MVTSQLPLKMKTTEVANMRGSSATMAGRTSAADKKREEEMDKAHIAELEKQLDVQNDQVY